MSFLPDWLRGTRHSDRARWVIALALALALHVAGLLVLYSLPLVAAAPAENKPVTVRLMLPPETEDQRNFTELPPNRADAAPKNPEFLSNVTSRARDRVPGGSDNLPRMKGEGDAPAVRLEPQGGAPSARSAAARPPEQTQQPTAKSTRDGLQKQSQVQTAMGPVSMRNPIKPEVFGQTSNDGLHAIPGGSEIYQPEGDRPDGNASLFGDLSLSTIAWDYAPWVQSFERKVMRGWFAPPAYSYGLLKEGGWGVFQLEVSKSGRVLHLDLLGEQGHPSLIRNAQSALHNATPLDPLPGDFPESTLTIRVRMTYPRVPSP